jgi:hypothetical protein
MVNKDNNSACVFSEALISYLYGEIGEREKAGFEAHLQKCGVCAEELSAFGAVRSSINEWRELDFATLQTPAVELPAPEKPAFEAEKISPSRSRLAFLSEFFSFSRSWTGAAAAFAALLICAGLFYLSVGFLSENGGKDISENIRKSSVAATIPDVKPSAKTPQTETAEPRKQIRRTESEKIENASVSYANERQNAKTAENVHRRRQNVQTAPSAVKKHAKNAPRNAKIQDSELFAFRDDEEDESLRLIDLFEEISDK